MSKLAIAYAMKKKAKRMASSEPSSDPDGDMVDRVMKKRMMSKGGMVANDDEAFEYEFDEPNNFDDLSRRDDLEFSYTGKNSGDELGHEDHDSSDVVERIMRSRQKKA